MAVVPHSAEAASRVAGSEMPGSQILAPEVSMMIAGAVGAPPAAQLGFAVGDGDDLDALAAGVGQPGRHRDRADLGDLVQGHQQRRVQPCRRAGGCPASAAV